MIAVGSVDANDSGGNAHEAVVPFDAEVTIDWSIPVPERGNQYIDDAIDLQNNMDGRMIGDSMEDGSSMIDILRSTLIYYHQVGLYEADMDETGNFTGGSRKTISFDQLKVALKQVDMLEAMFDK